MKVPHGPNSITPGPHDLKGLDFPYRTPLVRKVLEYLQSPSETTLQEARGILFDTTSRPLLTFIGDQLGRYLTPTHIPFAIDLLRLKSLPSTEGFLWALVSQEHIAVRLNNPPLLGGAEMAPLRGELAKLSLNPALYFSERTRARRPREVERVSSYPIVVLRRCASREEAPILIRDATRGGIEPEMNRRALETLCYLEDVDPVHRVIPGRLVAALVVTMSDLLRDPLNRMDTYAFVDRWLQKEPKDDVTEATTVRAAVHTLWDEYRSGPWTSARGCGLFGPDIIALLRHFDDPHSKRIIEEASNSTDTEVATIAMLCRAGGLRPALDKLIQATFASTPLQERLNVLAVFGYCISEDIDKLILPIFRHIVSRAFSEITVDDEPTALGAERISLISAFTRRLHTQPLHSGFNRAILAEALRFSVSGASFLATALVSIARSGRLMRLSFYDDPGLLTPIGLTIELLRHQSNHRNYGASESADEIERHFLLDGPARFGFEIGRIED
jgi:hypothetical protein